jgi:hypothetical protein
MTKHELIELLADSPDDTPVFDGKGYDLKPSSISSQKYDDWANSTKDAEGWETPAVAIGISIGPRF